MTPQQVVGLAVRLFSIWIGITALQAVGIAQALKGSGAHGPVWTPYLIAGIYAAGALLLWFFPMFVAHKLVPRTRFEDKLRLPAEQVVLVACVVLGLMVIVLRALPPLSAYVSLAVFWVGSGMTLSTLDASRHVEGLVGFLQLVAGAVLITKAHAISCSIMSAPAEVGEEQASAECASP